MDYRHKPPRRGVNIQRRLTLMSPRPSTAAVSNPSGPPHPAARTDSSRAGSRPDRPARLVSGQGTRWIIRASDRAERTASPGMSPTVTAANVITQSGRLSMAPSPRSYWTRHKICRSRFNELLRRQALLARRSPWIGKGVCSPVAPPSR
jgi:hypothetical protein